MHVKTTSNTDILIHFCEFRSMRTEKKYIYIGNIHENIPKIEYNQEADRIKYTNISQ